MCGNATFVDYKCTNFAVFARYYSRLAAT